MVPALRRAASLNSPIGCELPANTSSSTCQSSSISTMRRHLGLLVLLALLAALGSAVAEEAASGLQQANRKGNFDYFFLVRQWPATFCNDHSCTHRPPKTYSFTVHGLWPQRRDGTWPEFCSSTPLHMEDIYDLLPDLERAWPSWSSGDEQFWAHEWSRHGTCAAAVLGSERAFFKAVLRLHSRLNVQAALSRADIRPSNSQRYPVQALKDALEEEYGVMPHITCDGRGQLAEVWMCVNKKLKPIDCVDDPRPHALAANASAPSNYNCNMVTIPKLSRRQDADTQRQHPAALGPRLHNGAAAAEDDAPAAYDDVGAPQQQPLASLELLCLAGVALLVAAAAVAAATVFVQVLRGSSEHERELLHGPSCAAAAGEPLLHQRDGAPADVGVSV